MALWKQQVIDKGFNPSDFQWFPFMEDSISPVTGMVGETAHDIYDQGDTLNREGHLMTAAWVLHFKLNKMSKPEYDFLLLRYEDVLNKLQDPKDPSNFARTIVPNYWGSRHNVMSRDQMTPNLVALAMNDKPRTWKVFINHLLRRALLFTTNNYDNWSYPPGDPKYVASENKWHIADITALSYWNIYLRALPRWAWIVGSVPLYLTLCLFDLDTLINSVIKVLWYGKDPTNTDDIQHIGMLTQAAYSVPTPFSWLARKIYAKWRPLAMRTEFSPVEQPKYENETNPTQVVLNCYYRHLGNGPLLNEIWRPIVEELFGAK